MKLETVTWAQDIEKLNERLTDKTPRRVMQILRLNNFREVKQSRVPQLTHLIDTQWNMAMRFDHNGSKTCIQFWEEYIFRDIHPWINKSWTWLSWFIVQKSGKYYLFKVSSHFWENAQVEIIENGGNQDGSFASKKEIDQAITLLYGE